MGNTQSEQQPKRRRPSVHSGKLYIPSIPEANFSNSDLQPSLHKHFQSDDFDKHAGDLKENLPDDLKIYCNSIEVLYRFWCSNIEAMTELEYKEAAVLFYMNVFKLIPNARPLFRKNIELQAKQFFGMFRWLIVSLKQSDPQRLIKRIKMLGTMHKKMNIAPKWYQLFLTAFHEAMDETLKDKYNARTRFCMEQLYTVVMNIMLDKDFESLSSAKIAHLVKSLGKLEDCLNDKEGRQYLTMYMRQQFCVELILFYQECRTFKLCPSDIQRQQMGQKIVKKFIEENSECQINISYELKYEFYNTLKMNGDRFTVHIFDECMADCVKLMRLNIWNGFKKSIMKLAVDADINYQEAKTPKFQLETPSIFDTASNNSDSTSSKDNKIYYN